MKHYTKETSTIITVGFPFVAYKALAGHIALVGLGGVGGVALALVLYIFAATDLLMNIGNFVFILLKKRPLTDVCLLAFLVKFLLHKERGPAGMWYDLGTAVDVLVSFTLVAVVVGFDLFGYLSELQILVWNIATAACVVGAGLAQVRTALARTRKLNTGNWR